MSVWKPSDVPDKICTSKAGLDAEDISVGKFKMCMVRFGRIPVTGGSYPSMATVLSLPPDRGGNLVDTDIPLPLVEKGFECYGLDRTNRYWCRLTEEKQRKALEETGKDLLEIVKADPVSKQKCSLVDAHHHGDNCHLHFECNYSNEEEARKHVDAFKRIWDQRQFVTRNVKGLACRRD